MGAQAYQRSVTYFLALHYVISVLLVLLIQSEALGGWLVFSVFGYAVAWMFLPYMFSLFLFLWPEAKESYYIPKISSVILTTFLICGFSILLDSHFTHIGLQVFISLVAGIMAGILRPV